jgi:cell division protein FtsL
MAEIVVRNSNTFTLRKYQKASSRVKQGQGIALPLFILTVLFIASLIFFVWSRLQVTYVGYQISSANHKQQQLLKLNTQMKVEIASLKSLSRIELIAKTQVGLSTPEPHQVVFIK